MKTECESSRIFYTLPCHALSLSLSLSPSLSKTHTMQQVPFLLIEPDVS